MKSDLCERPWSLAGAVEHKSDFARTVHGIEKPGEHGSKFWMVDSGVVLQKLVIETGEVKPSYLGPPENFHRGAESGKGSE